MCVFPSQNFSKQNQKPEAKKGETRTTRIGKGSDRAITTKQTTVVSLERFTEIGRTNNVLCIVRILRIFDPQTFPLIKSAWDLLHGQQLASKTTIEAIETKTLKGVVFHQLFSPVIHRQLFSLFFPPFPFQPLPQTNSQIQKDPCVEVQEMKT